ncbi:protein SRC2 homolog [Cicer arietinum]|uniref:Protein SRC2 homolog n=1 Tax=Cicer arietinum TaxID=3827 RepID=A0A1S2XSX5_CICAR|nr:protein SRC2 homolog [Cicer arietinum]
MESRFIELKLISCKDIRAFNFFQKLTLYAQVSISTNDPTKQLTDEQKQRQRTPTHRDTDEDGSNPEWNHQTRFDLGFLSNHSDITDFFLFFEFRHDGVILGDKILGECRVPLSDLIQDVDGVARFVNYEIRSGDGKPNGIFNFSYRLNGIGTPSSQILDGRIYGYPVLTPEDCAPVQYPVSEIEKPCCYPMAPPCCSVQEGPFYTPVSPPAPPYGSYVSTGGYNYYYPPPQPSVYPYPPPPPHVEQVYPPIGPGAHPWSSGPYFERRW